MSKGLLDPAEGSPAGPARALVLTVPRVPGICWGVYNQTRLEKPVCKNASEAHESLTSIRWLAFDMGGGFTP
jgi:hypothetical protein